MKKILLFMLAAIMMLAVLGCSEQAEPASEPDITDEPTVEETAAPEPTAEPTPEPEPVITVPENELGLINVTVADLQAKLDAGDTFYLFVDGGDNVPYDYDAVNDGIATAIAEYEIPVEFCYADESIVTEDEYAALAAILGGTSAAAADGAEVSTLSGFYAFKDGALTYTAFGFVPSEENTNIASKVINFVFESDLFLNDHGMTVVTYEELKEKITSGERFLVYISRDTCPYCHAINPSLTTVLEAHPASVPVYYFCTQSFKTAINNNVDGAQEAWDAVKADIGFMYTPSLVIFEGGEQVTMFDGGVSSEYFDKTAEEKQAERDTVTAALEQWFVDNELYTAE